jgi:hypothetical protein
MALVANMAPKKRSRSRKFTPDDFNPMTTARARRGAAENAFPITRETIGMLKMFVPQVRETNGRDGETGGRDGEIER